MYIVLIDTFEINGQSFYEGVCFEYVYDAMNDLYIVEYEGNTYHIPPMYVIRTTRPTRFENISYDMYASQKRNDNTTDYFGAVKKAYNIDMKDNYAPQFRDGKNPFKDGN